MHTLDANWLALQITPDLVASVVVPIGLFTVPVVAILSRHQRQMAEIIHGKRRDDALAAEVEELRSEVSQLRSELRSLGAGSRAADTTSDLKNRLG